MSLNIDEVKEELKLHIREYLELHGRKIQSNGLFQCPNADHGHKNRDLNNSAQLYDTNTWICYTCHAGGDIFNAAACIENLPIGHGDIEFIYTTIVSLCKQLDIDFNPESIGGEYSKRKFLSDMLYYIVDNVDYDTVIPHLENRGYDKNKSHIISKTFGLFSMEPNIIMDILKSNYKKDDVDMFLRQSGVENHYMSNGIFGSDNIIIPVYNKNGSCITFAARRQELPKYKFGKTSIIFSKEELLYNLHNAKPYISKNEKVYVVEGFFDVIALHTAGIKNVVAVCGNSITKSKLEILKTIGAKNVVFSLDNDDGGLQEKGIQQILKEFRSVRGINLFVKLIDEGNDPEEFMMHHNFDADKYIRLPEYDALEFYIVNKMKHIITYEDSSEIETKIREVCLTIAESVGKNNIGRARYAKILYENLGEYKKYISPDLIIADINDASLLLDNPIQKRIIKKVKELYGLDTENINTFLLESKRVLSEIEEINETKGKRDNIANEKLLIDIVKDVLKDTKKLRTGLSMFDEGLPLYTSGTFIIVSGYPNMGKSSFFRWLTFQIMNNNEDVIIIYFTLDDDKVLTLTSMACIDSSIKLHLARSYNTLNDDEKHHLNMSLENLRSYLGDKLIMRDEADGSTLDHIIKTIIEVKHEFNNKHITVIIDSIKNIDDLVGSIDDNASVDIAMKKLRAMSRRYNINMFLNTHLKKDQSTGKYLKRPNQNSVKGSSKIGYDADAIIMVHSDYVAKDNNMELTDMCWKDEESGIIFPIMEVICIKNKRGPWRGHKFFKFKNITNEIIECTDREQRKYRSFLTKSSRGGTKNSSNDQVIGIGWENAL